jgi:hypothetical protein
MWPSTGESVRLRSTTHTTASAGRRSVNRPTATIALRPTRNSANARIAKTPRNRAAVRAPVRERPSTGRSSARAPRMVAPGLGQLQPTPSLLLMSCSLRPTAIAGVVARLDSEQLPILSRACPLPRTRPVSREQSNESTESLLAPPLAEQPGAAVDGGSGGLRRLHIDLQLACNRCLRDNA